MLLVFIASVLISGCSVISKYFGVSVENNSSKSLEVKQKIDTLENKSNKEDVAGEELEAIVKSSADGINDELWIRYADGKEEKLVSSKDNEDVTKKIDGIIEPQFSADRNKLYFMTSAWVTSASVHVIDIKTKEEKYVCPGNFLEIVQDGNYKGKLIVNQHRYLKGGGSYDHYYLIDEQGNEIKDLGEALDKNAKSYLYPEK